ncbi:hypothetical protein P1P91_05990 [Halomonas piscis]|uniref:Glycosyltransferase RgtA/B/C/D-like domain-containing protein n=1 Tax=Halomonas piscis TaxID=3031727 RepID=A0ABY9Z4F6_9GAMM|nr:hypothetical protein [Halomonas piscis]WNK21223.1 hypothetical protein P1P91_05990 [Halomonas piscis]
MSLEHTPPNNPPRLPAWLFPVVAMVAYWGLTQYLLTTGHLHEDAYILYIYAESLAHGNGIAYFPGGPPAEGATDFLWMIMLAGARYLGLDVAQAAGLLNGLGLAGIVWLAMRLLAPADRGYHYLLAGVLVTLYMLSSQIAQAALAGFSTALYGALTAALFCLLYAAPSRRTWLIPAVGIVLGLLRPDGVLMGVTATLLGAVIAWRQRELKPYLAAALACAAVGLAYFGWRYAYFGQLLPLPLYVKSTSVESLPGLGPHLDWLWSNRLLTGLALAALALHPRRGRMLAAAVPMLVLLLAFAFATQSQNAAFRFQAPGTIVLIMWAALLPQALAHRVRPTLLRRAAIVGLAVLALAATAQQASSGARIIRALQGNEYIYYFSYYLDRYLPPDTTIALTEAGRFAYWAQGKKYDLVGLNTAHTARHKVSPGYLQRLDPDLIFTHTAGMAHYDSMCQQDICELTPARALAGKRHGAHWQDVNYGVSRAPLAVLAHLEQHPDAYRVFAVRYYAGHDHLYLVKRSGRLAVDDFLRALGHSFTPEARRSYLDMKHTADFRGVFTR